MNARCEELAKQQKEKLKSSIFVDPEHITAPSEKLQSDIDQDKLRRAQILGVKTRNVTKEEVEACMSAESHFKPITGEDTYSNQKAHFYTAAGKKEFTGVVESAYTRKERLDKEIWNNKIINRMYKAKGLKMLASDQHH